MAQQFYNEEEAQAILREASARASGAAMSRDDLIRAAAELGIPAQTVIEAEQVHLRRTREEQLAKRFQAIQRQTFLSKVLRATIVAAICFATIVAAICFAIFVGSREEVFPALIIGVIFALSVIRRVPQHFLPHTEAYQTAFRRWQQKQGDEGQVP